MCSSFLRAWRVAESIRGWLSEEEARFLFSCACEVPEGAAIVEIGSFRGKSTVLLAHTHRQIFAIDPMNVHNDQNNLISIGEEDVQALQSAIAPFANVEWLRLSTDRCPIPKQRVSLLYIDGDHQYPMPLRDYMHFKDSLANDASIAFHDYGTFDGVSRSVHELIAMQEITPGRAIGSMYICRKWSYTGNTPRDEMYESPTTLLEDGGCGSEVRLSTHVSGFHLVALCHRFGRRGRAFAASIAKQVGNSFPIHITCFYSDALDAKYFVEGLLSGQSAPRLTLVQVDASRIMQRALHFSSVQLDHFCSHVVYLDCDLWFPPNFWQEYGETVQRELPGYWSTWVLDTEIATAEVFSNDWGSLHEELFRRECTGVRHNGFHGTVGHFQCVPKALAAYPRDYIKAVNRADEEFSRQAIKMSPDKRMERRIGKVRAYHLNHPQCWTGSAEQL
jgi:hypothetical protein